MADYPKHSFFKLSKRNESKLERLKDSSIKLGKTFEETLIEEVRSGKLKILDFVNIYDFLGDQSLGSKIRRDKLKRIELIKFTISLDEVLGQGGKLKVSTVQKFHSGFMKRDIIRDSKEHLFGKADRSIKNRKWWGNKRSSMRDLDPLFNKLARHAIEEGTTLEDIFLRNLFEGVISAREILFLVDGADVSLKILNFEVRRNKVLQKKLQDYHLEYQSILCDLDIDIETQKIKYEKLYKKMLRELKKEVK